MKYSRKSLPRGRVFPGALFCTDVRFQSFVCSFQVKRESVFISSYMLSGSSNMLTIELKECLPFLIAIVCSFIGGEMIFVSVARRVVSLSFFYNPSFHASRFLAEIHTDFVQLA